jgi:hypothetical protein
VRGDARKGVPYRDPAVCEYGLDIHSPEMRQKFPDIDSPEKQKRDARAEHALDSACPLVSEPTSHDARAIAISYGKRIV